MIHLDCLREWLNSKCTIKESGAVKTYCWKAIECELCKAKLPDRVLDPTITVATESSRKMIDLLKFEKPQGEFMVLESVTQQNIKIIHIVDMDSRSMIKVGRGHDCQVRITDISVSRLHAFFRKSTRGDFLLEDNGSKFGTLI